MHRHEFRRKIIFKNKKDKKIKVQTHLLIHTYRKKSKQHINKISNVFNGRSHRCPVVILLIKYIKK